MARENLERTLNVREKTGNLKINGFDRQFAEKLFCSRGVLSHRLLLLKERICSHGVQILSLKGRTCSCGEQFLSFKSNPKFEVIQLTPLK